MAPWFFPLWSSGWILGSRLRAADCSDDLHCADLCRRQLLRGVSGVQATLKKYDTVFLNHCCVSVCVSTLTLTIILQSEASSFGDSCPRRNRETQQNVALTGPNILRKECASSLKGTRISNCRWPQPAPTVSLQTLDIIPQC